jgi:hypothetical protein
MPFPELKTQAEIRREERNRYAAFLAFEAVKLALIVIAAIGLLFMGAM